MSLTQSKKDIVVTDKPQPVTQSLQRRIRSWLLTLEIYPIFLVTGFLCLYRINTTEFNTDQASIFGLARYAILYGLVPMTSNAASVGVTNPPAVVYILLIPALLSADPLWAAVQQALLTTTAVLLAYLFTRRYYGRLAGIVAALLYGTAAATIHYGRFIWQQNMMSPFVVLFMFALFWGVVERRSGWLAPAVVLLGLLVQLHESSVLLAVLLLVAVALAFKTIRWRDLVLAALFLFIIYAPYVLWEIHTNFVDIHTLIRLSKNHAVIDKQALNFYRLFLSPYGQQPTIASSVINIFKPWLSWLRYAVPLLLGCGSITALLLVLRPQLKPKSLEDKDMLPSTRGGLWKWWANFLATPSTGGLVLLLLWQIVPLVALSRHTFELQLHYLIFLMPGPYILIALFITKVAEWSREYRPYGSFLRYGVYTLIGLVIIGQLVGSLAEVIDISSGNFDDRTFYAHYRNDLASLQRAVSEADHVAQQHHLNHVYITTDDSTALALTYLSEQMQTPTTLFDVKRCLVLPNPTDGPAVLLVGPYDTLADALLGKYATTTLVDQPVRPGGAPFRLYIVTPNAVQPSAATGTFGDDLQLLDVEPKGLTTDSSLWMVTRWNMLHSARPGMRVLYNYALSAQLNGSNISGRSSQCQFTAMRAGDQLIAAFSIPQKTLTPTSVTMGVHSFTTTPYNPSFGPLHFETYIDQDSPPVILHTTDGSDTVTVPIS